MESEINELNKYTKENSPFYFEGEFFYGSMSKSVGK